MRCLEPSVYLGVKLDLVTGAVCVGPWRCALLVKALGCLNIIILYMFIFPALHQVALGHLGER
jgi:hypothetical protein